MPNRPSRRTLEAEVLLEPIEMPFAGYPCKLGAVLFCPLHEIASRRPDWFATSIPWPLANSLVLHISSHGRFD